MRRLHNQGTPPEGEGSVWMKFWGVAPHNFKSYFIKMNIGNYIVVEGN